MKELFGIPVLKLKKGEVINCSMSTDDGDDSGFVRYNKKYRGKIVVEYGEHILRLADRYYGKNRYSALKIILEANPEITDQDLVLEGQVLRLPIIDPDDSATSENNEPHVSDINVEDHPVSGSE